MAKIKVIRQGESLPFVFDRDGEDITGYVCTIFVKQFPSNVSDITRIIEPSVNEKTGIGEWSGFLTQTETSALDVGLWIINAKLVKASTDEEEAIPVRFTIAVPWA